MRWVVFRGHGFSLLEKPTLRGLQTRAVPAGVNGPPLQTTIEIVKESYSTIAKHYVSEGNTRRLQRESEDDETPQRARELLEKASLFPCAEEAHCEALLEDAGAGFKEGRLKPSFADNVGIPLAGARRLIASPRKASVFQLR